jgi:hypothetical protein
LWSALGIVVVALTLWDVTRTVVVTTGPARRIRFSRNFHWFTWLIWQQIPSRLPAERRERGLAMYAPLSLLLLLASWIALLVVGWWLVLLGLQSDIKATTTRIGEPDVWTLLYFSGTSLLTIGYGDVIATGWLSRTVALAEALSGLATLALLISYLPALYAAFSRREAFILTLDRVHAQTGSRGSLEVKPLLESFETYEELRDFFVNWERWVAELLESHVSFPVLAYFRSQTEERSWLGALALVLNLATLILAVDPTTDSKAPFWLYRRGQQALHEILVQLHLPADKAETDESIIQARQQMSADRQSYFETDLYPIVVRLAHDGSKVRSPSEAWTRVESYRQEYWPRIETVRQYLRFQPNIFMGPGIEARAST